MEDSDPIHYFYGLSRLYIIISHYFEYHPCTHQFGSSLESSSPLSICATSVWCVSAFAAATGMFLLNTQWMSISTNITPEGREKKCEEQEVKSTMRTLFTTSSLELFGHCSVSDFLFSQCLERDGEIFVCKYSLCHPKIGR